MNNHDDMLINIQFSNCIINSNELDCSGVMTEKKMKKKERE